jgi:hypothetical protein
MNLEKTEKAVEKEKNKTKRTPRVERTLGAEERVKAVLAVWTERCRPGQVCRELGIPWVTMAQWQDRAMEGMLQALEPRVSLGRGTALSPRLQQLLEKRQRGMSAQRLTERLSQIQTLKKVTGDPKME